MDFFPNDTTNEGFVVPQSTGSAPFTPASISGITAFWNFGNSSALTLNGSNITTVTDPVGGNNLTQATDANRPVFVSSGGLNNRGYATFNGTSQYMEAASFAAFGGDATGLAMVVRFAAPTQDNGSLLGYKTSGSNPYFYFLSGDAPSNSGKVLTRIANDTDGISLFSASNAFVDTSTWKTVVVQCAPQGGASFALEIYVNSSTVDATSGATANVGLGSTTPIVVGGRDNPAIGLLSGRIEYIAIYNRSLNATEIGQLVSY